MGIFTENFESYTTENPPSDPPWQILSGTATVVSQILPTKSLKVVDGIVAISEPGADLWTNQVIVAKAGREQYNLSGVTLQVVGIGDYAMGLNLAGGELRLFKDGSIIKNVSLATPTEKLYAYYLKFSVQVLPDSTVELKGKIWREDQTEPDWIISYVDTENPYTIGAPALSSYGGRTIYFDDVNMAYETGVMQKTPTAITDGVMSEEIPQHEPNHIWGQLQTLPGGSPLVGKEIWLNREGQTVPVNEIDTPKGYQGNPNVNFPYPAITGPNGNFDLSWKMHIEGTLNVATEFPGDDTYEPSIGAAHAVTVVGAIIPPEAPIVQIPAPTDIRASNNPLGTNIHAKAIINDLEAILDSIVAAGINWVRFGISWQDIEPQKGVFNWDIHDAVINACVARKISILGGLWYGNSNYSSTGHWAGPPDDYNDYANYCRLVVQRYKGIIKCWEIWNEPNAGGFWFGAANAVQYTQLLKLAYTAIKEVDPSATVIAPSLWGNDANFLYEIYTEGGKDFMDAISVHPYAGDFLPNHVWGWAQSPEEATIPGAGYSPFDFPYLRTIRRCMEMFGDVNKPIWITEIGWNTGHTPNPNAYYPGTMEEMQLDGIKIAWDYSQWKAAKLGPIVRFMQYKWKDNLIEPESKFGLIHVDGTFKPAYQMYKNLAAIYNNESLEPLLTPTSPIITMLAGATIGYSVGQTPGAIVGGVLGASIGSLRFRQRLTTIAAFRR